MWQITTSPDAVATTLGMFVLFSGFRDTTEMLLIDPAVPNDNGGMLDLQSVVRHRPAIAATARHVIVAGGTDDSGVPIDSADILDAVLLDRIATVPCVARAGATAHALPNGQIAIVGGEPANDAIELFTPPPPALP